MSEEFHQTTLQKIFCLFTGCGGIATGTITVDPVSIAQHISIYGGAFLVAVQIADYLRRKYREYKSRRRPSNDA